MIPFNVMKINEIIMKQYNENKLNEVWAGDYLFFQLIRRPICQCLFELVVYLYVPEVVTFHSMLILEYRIVFEYLLMMV